MNLTNDSVLQMHELAQRQESDEEILIGRTDNTTLSFFQSLGLPSLTTG